MKSAQIKNEKIEGKCVELKRKKPSEASEVFTEPDLISTQYKTSNIKC